MPNLVSLKLNDSLIKSIRDLGTALRGVQFLWISRSQLQDLSGINALPNLKELYASFNNIADLSALFYHEKLEVLDLEGNEVANLDNLDYLETISNLYSLNLRDNPIQKNEKYRAALENKFTGKLQVLDDEDFEIALNTLDRNAQNPVDLEDLEDNLPEQQLYDALQHLKLITEDDKKQWVKELDAEPKDQEILLMSVRKKKSNKVKEDTRGASELNRGDEAFFGNPLKALKAKKKNDMEELQPPKDIMNYFEMYRPENQVKKFVPRQSGLFDFEQLVDSDFEGNKSPESSIRKKSQPQQPGKENRKDKINGVDLTKFIQNDHDSLNSELTHPSKLSESTMSRTGENFKPRISTAEPSLTGRVRPIIKNHTTTPIGALNASSGGP